MKKMAGAFLLATTLAACSNTPEDRTLGGAAIGAGTGAVVGGLATHSAGGAVVGGVVGGAAGALIGRATTPGQCIYRDQYGRRYTAAC
jgi:hypothetical protein